MRNEEKDRDRAREIRRFEAEEEAAALAAKLLRINSNYDPLWNMSPQAPLVWRIGAGILGMFFLFASICFFWMGLEAHDWGIFPISLLFLLISALPLWNAFKGRKVVSVSRKHSSRE
jgi:hypothetical protein